MQMMSGGKGRGSTADFDMNVDPARIVQQGQKIFSNLGASTSAPTSVANLLTQSGKPTTEGDVVRRAIDNQWAVTDANLPSWQRGGSNANEQLQLLTSYGLRADLLAGYNETGIANLVRSGRGVIVAVDAGVIWESTQYATGQVNHAVTLTGAVYAEADGALLGFYVTDSGRAKVSDMTRFIPIDLFREAANVPGAYSLYTIEPVKLWDENIEGTGNEGANQITGNRGDNVLSGMAGDETLVDLKSRRLVQRHRHHRHQPRGREAGQHRCGIPVLTPIAKVGAGPTGWREST